jgi:hypothetical protein
MTNPSSKDEEELAFSSFCEAIGTLSREEFAFKDKPDFVRFDASLAVEVVSYHRDFSPGLRRGSLRRRTESAMERLLRDAQLIYSDMGGPPVDLYLGPAANPRITPQTARDLAAHVAAVAPQGRIDEDAVSLAGVVEWGMVGPTPPYQGGSRWQVAAADFLDVDVESVRSVLREKEVLLPTYRGIACSVWLLIYASPRPVIGSHSGGRWSTCGGVTQELLEARFQSSFDLVYYHDHDSDQLVRLRLQP